LEPKPDDFTTQAPGLLKLASGDILLTCVRVYKGMETGKDWDPGVTSSAMALCRSTDGGKTFVEEPPIWKRAPVLRYQGGAPWNIQLKSGRVLLSYHSAARQYGAPYTIGVAFSDDDGHIWKVLDNRVALSDGYGVEPCIAELADGSLMMSIRTRRSQIYLSRSTDQGETWSEPVPSGLTHPASITRLIRIPGTEDLLMFFNNTPPGKRAPFTAALSRDGGRTWRIVGNIVHADKSAPRGGIEVGVADVIFRSDNKVLVAFSWTMPPWARQRIPTCAAVIDGEWFYRPVSHRFYHRAHPRLYPAEQKQSGQDVEPDASILKTH
jgi:sialidase-1